MDLKKIDIEPFYNPIILEEADRIYRDYKIKIRPLYRYDDTIKIKIIDRFNYVTHVEFTLKDNEITVFSCDGSTKYCNNSFCSHCYAAFYHLQQNEFLPVFLSTVNEEDIEEHTQPTIESFSVELSVINENGEERSEINENNTDQYMIDENDSDKITDLDNKPVIIAKNVNVDDSSHEPSTLTSFAPRQMKILLGTNTKTNESVYLFPNDTDCLMNTNMGIIGTMGTGKTQFTKSLVTQLFRNQIDNYKGSPIGILIFDYKGDYNETKTDFVQATNARIIKPYKMPFNPLSLNLKKHNKALLPMHTANTFKDTISKIYNLGPKQENTLFDCIMAAYEEQLIFVDNESTWNRPAPTFDIVYRQYEKSSAFNDNDKLAVVMKKLKGFTIFDSDPLRTVSLSKLLNGVAVIDISDYDEDIQNLVVAITLDQLYAQMQTFGSSKTDGKYRQLKTFILVDEADNFMKMGFTSMRKIMKEGRAFGVGTILSTQSLAHFSGSDDDYSKYIITWVIHNVNDLNRKNIESILNQPQKSAESELLFQSIKGLKKHESVVKISNNDPIIMHDKPFWELYNELTGRN